MRSREDVARRAWAPWLGVAVFLLIVSAARFVWLRHFLAHRWTWIGVGSLLLVVSAVSGARLIRGRVPARIAQAGGAIAIGFIVLAYSTAASPWAYELRHQAEILPRPPEVELKSFTSGHGRGFAVPYSLGHASYYFPTGDASSAKDSMFTAWKNAGGIVEVLGVPGISLESRFDGLAVDCRFTDDPNGATAECDMGI